MKLQIQKATMSIDFLGREKEMHNNSGLLNANIYTTEGEAVVTILHWTQSLETQLETVMWHLTKTDNGVWFTAMLWLHVII